MASLEVAIPRATLARQLSRGVLLLQVIESKDAVFTNSNGKNLVRMNLDEFVDS